MGKGRHELPGKGNSRTNLVLEVHLWNDACGCGDGYTFGSSRAEGKAKEDPLKVACQESLAKDSPRTRLMGIWMVAGSEQYSISFPKRIFTYLIYKNYFEISQSCWYCTGNSICFVQHRVAGYPQSTQLLSNLLMIGSEPLITTHEHFTFPLDKHRNMKALCIIGEKLLKSLTQSHWVPFSKAFVNIWPNSQYSF